MAIPFLPILKAIPTILTALGEVTSSLSARRASGAVVKVEERTKRLEEDLLKTGSALAELARQVQALAEELRTQAEATAARERKVTVLLWTSIAALVCSAGSAVIVLVA